LDDIHAALDRALAQKRDPLHLDAQRIRPVANRLVGFPKSLVVRSDPFDMRVSHPGDLGPIARR
jgi:hypothetical protein